MRCCIRFGARAGVGPAGLPFPCGRSLILCVSICVYKYWPCHVGRDFARTRRRSILMTPVFSAGNAEIAAWILTPPQVTLMFGLDRMTRERRLLAMRQLDLNHINTIDFGQLHLPGQSTCTQRRDLCVSDIPQRAGASYLGINDGLSSA
jgi:hypothetical protein